MMRLRKATLSKWLLALVLSLAMAVAGCGGQESSAPDGGAKKTQGDSLQGKQTDAEPTAADGDGEEEGRDDEERDDEELDVSGLPPLAAGLAKYWDMKGKSYETLNPFIEKLASSDPMTSLSLLPLTMADLGLLPLTMLSVLPEVGGNVWEGELLMLFDGGSLFLVAGIG